MRLAHRIAGQLVPDFDLVAVGVGEKNVGLAGTELATMLDLSSSPLDCRCGAIDVASVGQSKSEVLDPTGPTDVLRAFLEHEDVVCPRRLRLEETLLAVDRQHPEDIVVELERSLQIAHGEGEVGQAERFDHRTPPAGSDPTSIYGASGNDSSRCQARLHRQS